MAPEFHIHFKHYKQKLFNFVFIAILVVIILNAYLYWMQPRMVFFPSAPLDADPSQWGLDFENANIATDDGVSIHGWLIPAPNAKKVILFAHGNAGNISHRGESIRIFHQLGLSVLIFDYRGYGKSQGSPNEQGIYKDALAAWKYLTVQKKIAAEDVIIFGRSLGGVVATQLSKQVQPGGLIIESSFASARDMAQRIFPFFHYLIYLRYQFNAEKYIKDISCPVLIMHSPEDDIIPYEFGKKLFLSANQPKQWFELRGDHNSGFILTGESYIQTLKQFIQAL